MHRLLNAIPSAFRVSPKRLDIFAFCMLASLYGSVGYSSFGYDDEIGNIKLIERFGAHAVRIAQTTNVHPPGQYLLNWILYKGLGDWRLVRLSAALAAAAAVTYVVRMARERLGLRSAVLVVLLVGLNPAIVMWCTGVRWYAYFVPVLLWVSVTPSASGWKYWGKCCTGLVCLGYLAYAVLLVAPGVLYLYWRDHPGSRIRRLRGTAAAVVLALLAYLPQLYVFFTVHYANRSKQISTLARSLSGYVVAHLGNQGVFPVSIPGLLSLFGAATLTGMTVHRCVARDRVGNFCVPYATVTLLAVVTGLAGKFRNLVIASPWQGLLFAEVVSTGTERRVALGAVSLVVLGNCWGTADVVRHAETTKNSWNLPIRELISVIEASDSRCKNDIAIFTHDPTISYQLTNRGRRVFGPYSYGSQSKSAGLPECAIAVKTFAGSVHASTLAALYKELDTLRPRETGRFLLGRDNAYRIKRRFDARYPEHAVEGIWYRGPLELSALPTWTRANVGVH